MTQHSPILFRLARNGLALLCGLALLAGFSMPGQAQQRVPQSRAEIQLSFAPLVRQAAPAVVNVYTRKVERVVQRSPLLDDPIFRRFFGDQQMFGIPRERVAQSLGSGVIVEADGVIVTNNHVIDGATEIVVALADRREFEAKVIAADPKVDLAILRIDPKGELLHALEFRDSDDLQVGELVLAIGNPFGVGQTVTQGIVSALGRTDVGDADAQSFIQTDAAINPGNSGGALVTMDGKLAGINTAIFSKTGGSVGIGFAIPSNLVAATVASALSGKGIRRPWLGANGGTVTTEVAQGLGLERPGGVLVGQIYPGGPADRAGLRTGDVILKVDGREVNDPRALKFRIATRKLGEAASLEVLRQGRPRTLSIPLTEAPETPPREVTQMTGNHPFAGATVANLSPAFAEEIGFDALANGVIVLNLTAGSPANRIRLRPGDLVVKVNGADIKDVGDLQRAMRGNAQQWLLILKRGDQMLQLQVRA
ncbi:DegQ family serine endoprotease [Ferrovibrio sp.]|uniref:DegQ family serine endoprotease n=1 Tax=Ferrovibrio sp. TaxID=1917215 RepID=UPI001B648ABC|nr:DegQ family serine endoprotease [Ferrovibrio sp.]MBP7064208.1 DegQ family serine endoprotease [Ferrovibrio sp.]